MKYVMRHGSTRENWFGLNCRLRGNGRPVGRITLGAQIEPLVTKLRNCWRTGKRSLAQYLISYRPGETFGSAFGKLFARFVLAGLILMDPLDAGLTKWRRRFISMR
jgi:hypothetical protein